MNIEHVPIGSERLEPVERITPCVAPFASMVELVYVTADGEACVHFSPLRFRQRLIGVVDQSDERVAKLNFGGEAETPCSPSSDGV